MLRTHAAHTAHAGAAFKYAQYGLRSMQPPACAAQKSAWSRRNVSTSSNDRSGDRRNGRKQGRDQLLALNHRSGMNGFMPRTARVAPGGFVYHVLNRSVAPMHMFRKDVDFEMFERVMVEGTSGNPSASCRTVFGTHGSSRRPATEGEPSRERYQRVAACGSGGGNFGGYTHIDIQSPWAKLIASLFMSRNPSRPRQGFRRRSPNRTSRNSSSSS